MLKYFLLFCVISALGHQAYGAYVKEDHPKEQLLPEKCGEIQNSRMADGPVARLYEHPWMALIAYQTKDGMDFKCTGTIINSRYILTAANCLNGKIAGVRVGEYNKCTHTDCDGDKCESHVQDIPVEDRVKHDGYSTNPVENNIALLRLKEPIDFSFKNVAPICLPVSDSQRNLSLEGKSGVLASWKLREPGSCALGRIYLPLITRDECRKKYEANSNLPIRNVSDNQFCADERASGACGITSGDPLMLEDGGKMVQYGLSSHGPFRCPTDYPGVYTDVSKHVDWILLNIKE